MKKYSLLIFLLLCMIHYKSFAANLRIESPSFTMNAMIPNEYTCNGADKSPPLKWTRIPKNTQSVALIVEDPDAPNGVWTHWILFNIPPTVQKLDAGSPPPNGAKNGKNSWGSLDYRGPCPPAIGAVHSYHFKLYALDSMLNLENGTARDLVLDAMTGHVIGNAELVGYYQNFKK